MVRSLIGEAETKRKYTVKRMYNNRAEEAAKAKAEANAKAKANANEEEKKNQSQGGKRQKRKTAKKRMTH